MFAKGSKIKEIGNRAFIACGVCSVELPYGLQTVEDSCFSGTKLAEIAFPSSVLNIGRRALSMCPELKTVVLPE